MDKATATRLTKRMMRKLPGLQAEIVAKEFKRREPSYSLQLCYCSRKLCMVDAEAAQSILQVWSLLS